ncbi:hypothetical protein Ssi02_60280 [Sinosporangium siamense]|uniref:Uncharacterized protein n=1 Tax=Sinosporangium siamense TaxID=1367973 RepID=A0A919RL33_9ACTN|nr:hypothetical protein Ssi02_60280 [Sinosporangium siamense]
MTSMIYTVPAGGRIARIVIILEPERPRRRLLEGKPVRGGTLVGKGSDAVRTPYVLDDG